jgi:hypothetical protein
MGGRRIGVLGVLLQNLNVSFVVSADNSELVPVDDEGCGQVHSVVVVFGDKAQREVNGSPIQQVDAMEHIRQDDVVLYHAHAGDVKLPDNKCAHTMFKQKKTQ